MARKPVDVAIFFEHRLTLLVNIHKPTRMRAVHELRAAAVTVRIAVADIIDFPDNATLMEYFSNRLIDLPNILTFPFGFGVVTIFINDMYNGNFLTLCHVEVFFAICWRDMNNARPIIDAHVVSMPNLLSILAAFDTKKWFVRLAYKFFTLECANNFIVQDLMLSIGKYFFGKLLR
ncbi:hypothetical protein D3C85_1127090 [compost metagenome]